MEQLLSVLQWAFPAGFSAINLVLLGAIWQKNKAHLVADTRHTWQAIAESNNEALLRQNDEIRSLREALGKMEGILYKLSVCRYYAICPVRPELQKYKPNSQSRNYRQPIVEQKGFRHPRDHPVEPGTVDGSDGEPL